MLSSGFGFGFGFGDLPFDVPVFFLRVSFSDFASEDFLAMNLDFNFIVFRVELR